jgi:hypothetical protein
MHAHGGPGNLPCRSGQPKQTFVPPPSWETGRFSPATNDSGGPGTRTASAFTPPTTINSVGSRQFDPVTTILTTFREGLLRSTSSQSLRAPARSSFSTIFCGARAAANPRHRFLPLLFFRPSQISPPTSCDYPNGNAIFLNTLLPTWLSKTLLPSFRNTAASACRTALLLDTLDPLGGPWLLQRVNAWRNAPALCTAMTLAHFGPKPPVSSQFSYSYSISVYIFQRYLGLSRHPLYRQQGPGCRSPRNDENIPILPCVLPRRLGPPTGYYLDY